MMEKRWIVPVAVGMLTLSLVGCGYTETGTTTRIDPAAMGNSDVPYVSGIVRSSADNNVYRSSFRSGEEMVDDAHYYASDDGSVKDGDGTQEGCKNCPRHHLREDIDQMGDDVERALRDVGRTMDDMRTDV